MFEDLLLKPIFFDSEFPMSGPRCPDSDFFCSDSIYPSALFRPSRDFRYSKTSRRLSICSLKMQLRIWYISTGELLRRGGTGGRLSTLERELHEAFFVHFHTGCATINPLKVDGDVAIYRGERLCYKYRPLALIDVPMFVAGSCRARQGRHLNPLSRWTTVPYDYS